MNGELIDGAQVDAFVMGADQVEAVQIALRAWRDAPVVADQASGAPGAVSVGLKGKGETMEETV